MAKVIDFLSRRAPGGPRPLLDGFSIEVMPRTAAKVARFADILPAGTRVYVAHIDGTPIADMVKTAARIAREGFEVMPHVPARSIPGRAALAEWIGRYRDEAGVEGALLLGGGRAAPAGPYHSSMQLMETGLFDRAGFRRLHVAGHPEGNKDICPDGREDALMAALRWKQEFAELSDLEMAVVTQFVFDARPVIGWAARLRAAGVRLPIHVGVAGPAKLQTLIKYALACGVGPSVRVLQRRAADVTRLMRPFAPDEVLADLAAHKAAHPEFQLERVHLFPLGGIDKAAEYAAGQGGAGRAAAAG
jgi:methylenetetrahydrofolate reductase (NADPH)